MQLHIENVSKTYPNGTQALKDVTLSIGPGMYGLLGPNGAGKSTLMRSIATLQQPDTGSIWLDDNGETIDVQSDPGAIRRRLGYLPQSFGLYPKATAGRLLHYLATLKGLTDRSERTKTVDLLFERTNLSDARSQRLGGFSGGMKQRFGIAVALLNDPRLIIVDEPTAGLDPAERTRFLNLLSELGEESIVILSTHIVNDVREMCTEMAIIREGAIRFEGSPLTAVQHMDGTVWEQTIEKDAVDDYEAEYDVLSAKFVGGRPVLRLYGAEPPTTTAQAVAPTLEDVYFARMQELVSADALRGSRSSTGAAQA